MEIKEVPISKLKPAKYNPRKDLTPDDPEYQKIKNSMVEFGDVEPIVWNKATGNIVGGHQRYKIYKEMGHKKCKVSVVDLTETAEAVLNIALNKASGEWDYPKLKDLIAEIDTGEFDIEFTGFDADEIKELFDFEVRGINENDFKDRLSKDNDVTKFQITLSLPNEMKEKVEQIIKSVGDKNEAFMIMIDNYYDEQVESINKA